MKPTRRQLRAMRLVNWPLLQILFLNRWFRMVFLLVLVSLLGIGVSLLRIWRTSPAGFTPVVRVSLLDLAQARSLRHSALRLAAAGRHDDAARAWQLALLNNMADPELVRGAVRHALQVEHLPRPLAAPTVSAAFWLLRLTRTNRADVELTARTLERHGLPDHVLELLGPLEAQLTQGEEVAYLRALFETGNMTEFGRRWARGGKALADDPELSLYLAAYQAGWGPPETMSAGKARLATALADPAREALARRLELALALKNLDAGACQEALLGLERRHNDRLVDHLSYWMLLAGNGQAAAARRLAESHVHLPAMPWEVVRLTETYLALGMRDYAQRFLERYAHEFGDSATIWAASIWTLYADLLIDTRQWEPLLALALEMRLLDEVRFSLAAFSYFLEGRALYALNRHDQALACFQAAARRPFHSAGAAFNAATSMLRIGNVTEAWQILQPLEAELRTDPAYWQALFEAAYARKDEATLFRAAARAYELRPTVPMVQNNYAAALLINRQRPEEAAKLTLQILQRAPNSLIARINHSFALTLNRRTLEAEAQLKTVDGQSLTGVEAAVFHLNWFELHCDLKQFDAAWRDLDRIDTRHLFPRQLRWLEQKKQTLPPRRPQ